MITEEKFNDLMVKYNNNINVFLECLYVNETVHVFENYVDLYLVVIDDTYYLKDRCNYVTYAEGNKKDILDFINVYTTQHIFQNNIVLMKKYNCTLNGNTRFVDKN